MGDINQVRQIMMNELGLTREFVRDMATDIIEQTIARQLGSGLLEKTIRVAVKDGLNELMRKPSQYGDPIKDMVRTAVVDEVKRQVLSQVEIEVRPKFNVPA